MNVYAAVMQTILSASEPSAVAVIVFALIWIGVPAAIVLPVVIEKHRFVEEMDGVWYCAELKMQISFTASHNTFMTESGERILCWYEKYPRRDCIAGIELLCKEWEHPLYPHGKTLFRGKIEECDEMSMVIYHRKTNKHYTFMRTDKIG